MKNPRRLLVLGPITALVFAACAGDDPAAPGDASPTIPFETPAMGESPWPDDATDGSPPVDPDATPDDDAAGDGPIEGLPAEPDPSIADTLPDEVGGVALSVESLDAMDVTDRRAVAEVLGVVSDLGLEEGQVEGAAATGDHETGEIVVMGLRIQGVDPGSIVDAAENRLLLDPAAVGATREQANGRDVLRVADVSPQAPVTYVFTASDSLYIVSASEALAREALNELPE
jgi:hypothetical protein